jgi:hypothetical protein
MTLCKSVYCFPYRAEFVGIGEHGGWDKSLKSYAEAVKEPQLSISDLAALQRGSWNDRGAKFGWGVAHFLDQFAAPKLPALFGDLRRAWDQGSRRDVGGGKWERIPEFEVAPRDQAQIFTQHLGETFFADFTRFARNGTPPGIRRDPSGARRVRKG